LVLEEGEKMLQELIATKRASLTTDRSLPLPRIAVMLLDAQSAHGINGRRRATPARRRQCLQRESG